ncbi:MAG: DUF4167 domain-containing protein [Caulobacter sp.]|nr:DUF4167 domain-containing protein [Caulobacter sp.]
MRDFKGMKRQRGRNRGSSGGQGGKPQQHNANRAFDSNGPEGIKVRGAAQSVFEKYQQLSRDAGSAGDRVLAENYLQHAEHYFRTLRAMQPHRPVSDIVGREQFASGFDIDFEAEPGEAPETPAEPETAENNDSDNQRDNRDNRDAPRQDARRDRDDRPREGRPREDRARDDRQRDDRPREERPRDERPREDRPREERDSGGRRDRWREKNEARDPMPVIDPQATAAAAAPEPVAPEPAPAPAPARKTPRLRGQDGAVSELPAFLGRSVSTSEEAPADEVKKPRRRRAPRTFEGGEAGEGAKSETEEV